MSQCLAALIDGTNEKPDQIVVVNGGDERTDQIVDTFGARQGIDVQLVKTINKNLAASRNVGLPSCAGDIIAMTDDDAAVFPDWVAQMKRAHTEHPEAGAIGGKVIGTNIDSLVGKIADLTTFPSWSVARVVRTIPGVNVSYKRQAVERVGKQDETLFRGEDVDYNWRVSQLGYTIYFDPSIKVYHHHRPTLRAFLYQHYMYGRAYFLVRRKWPEMYCVYPHSLRRPRNCLKAVNFLAAIFYEPLRDIAHLPGLADKLWAYPILLANQAVWRGGMIREKLLTD
jgi:GT2 family glycosyltransferase